MMIRLDSRVLLEVTSLEVLAALLQGMVVDGGQVGTLPDVRDWNNQLARGAQYNAQLERTVGFQQLWVS